MLALPTFLPGCATRPAPHFGHARTAAPVRRRRPASRFLRELHFALLDFVDVVLALESCFHIALPDEMLPLAIDDLVDYPGSSRPGWRAPLRTPGSPRPMGRRRALRRYE